MSGDFLQPQTWSAQRAGDSTTRPACTIHHLYGHLSLEKTWDSKEGRWIFEVKADASVERIEIGQKGCFQDNENGYERTELIGVDITAVHKKYF